jgi:hypothetical protein
MLSFQTQQILNFVYEKYRIFLQITCAPKFSSLLFFFIDNWHTPTSGRVRKYRWTTEEFFKGTCDAISNSSNIESEEEFFGF